MRLYMFAYFLRLLLTPRIPTLVLTFVHDDTTFADHPFLPGNDADAAPPVVDAKLTPLPHAIRLFTEIIRDHLRLRIASHKTLLFQPPLPDDDRRALPRLLHLFPDGSRVSDSCFVLAVAALLAPSPASPPSSRTLSLPSMRQRKSFSSSLYSTLSFVSSSSPSAFARLPSSPTFFATSHRLPPPTSAYP